MHLRRFRKADRLADAACDARPERQMFPLDFLGVTLAWTMHLRVEMPGVRPPMSRIKARETTGLQQRFQLQKDLIHLPDIMPP